MTFSISASDLPAHSMFNSNLERRRYVHNHGTYHNYHDNSEEYSNRPTIHHLLEIPERPTLRLKKPHLFKRELHLEKRADPLRIIGITVIPPNPQVQTTSPSPPSPSKNIATNGKVNSLATDKSINKQNQAQQSSGVKDTAIESNSENLSNRFKPPNIRHEGAPSSSNNAPNSHLNPTTKNITKNGNANNNASNSNNDEIEKKTTSSSTNVIPEEDKSANGPPESRENRTSMIAIISRFSLFFQSFFYFSVYFCRFFSSLTFYIPLSNSCFFSSSVLCAVVGLCIVGFLIKKITRPSTPSAPSCPAPLPPITISSNSSSKSSVFQSHPQSFQDSTYLLKVPDNSFITPTPFNTPTNVNNSLRIYNASLEWNGKVAPIDGEGSNLKVSNLEKTTTKNTTGPPNPKDLTEKLTGLDVKWNDTENSSLQNQTNANNSNSTQDMDDIPNTLAAGVGVGLSSFTESVDYSTAVPLTNTDTTTAAAATAACNGFNTSTSMTNGKEQEKENDEELIKSSQKQSTSHLHPSSHLNHGQPVDNPFLYTSQTLMHPRHQPSNTSMKSEDILFEQQQQPKKISTASSIDLLNLNGDSFILVSNENPQLIEDMLNGHSFSNSFSLKAEGAGQDVFRERSRHLLD